MYIGGFKFMQTGDIDKLSDNIYFAGCSRDCWFCLNPELKLRGNHPNMSLDRIYEEFVTESMCNWVCFLGGEPLDNFFNDDYFKLIDMLKNEGKKIMLFTSLHNRVESQVYDHIHIDLKLDDFMGEWCYPEFSNLSYGIVCTEDKLNNLDRIPDFIKYRPLYVKDLVGHGNRDFHHDIFLKCRSRLKDLGFKNLKEGKIQV